MSASTPPSPPIPDLLGDEPRIRIDVGALRQPLSFGFALGSPIEAFDEVIAAAAIPPSEWDSAAFERDLFLTDLAAGALSATACGREVTLLSPWLLRLLGHPPRAPSVVAFRQAIFAELIEKPSFRVDFEEVYTCLSTLRARLSSEGVSRRGNGTQRRLEILRSVAESFDRLATGFEGASSGLSRMRAFGAFTLASSAHERLVALLDHEAHRGTVDLSVRVGADGELRTFQIVRIAENKQSPFYSSALSRFLSRLRMMVLGYRVGPTEVAERLLEDVFTALETPIAVLFQLLGDMELYLAGLGLRDRAIARGLPVCLPEWVTSENEGTSLSRLHNPLLLMARGASVPCTIEIAEADGVVVVTGPNSGGKTRLLQSVGFAQLLAQSGMFVLAERARLRHARGLFVSLVQESRADQPEGQLGMELMRIRRLFETLSLGSVVLLDELCSGTNPSEGEEIASLVISLLPELRSQVLITTHLLTLATHLKESPPVAHLSFLQVELDPNEEPTYGFVSGVARTSLAHRVAARLGVTRGGLLALVAARKRAEEGS